MCAFEPHPLAGREAVVKSRAENSINLLSIPWPASRGPKPLSSKAVLGMTLHRKSVQPVGSPRSPPAASRLWAQTAWIKVTLHSHRALQPAALGLQKAASTPPSFHYILSARLSVCRALSHPVTPYIPSSTNTSACMWHKLSGWALIFLHKILLF